MVCWLVPATAAVKPIVGERDVYTYAYSLADGIVYICIRDGMRKHM